MTIFRICAILALGLAPLATPAQAADLAARAPVMPCNALIGTDLAAIGGAQSAVTAASETTSDGIAVCAVEARLAPAIKLRLLLPTQTWTQRYLQLGCGGLCGRITLMSGASNGCKVLAGGDFAMAATDMGHEGGRDDDASWGLDAQKRTDFAWRAQHLTAAAAKALIDAFYGQPARYAYFNGCSDGGREALMEAERFPEDFDGVIAGAPAMLFQVQNTLYHGWQAVSNTDAHGKAVLLADRLPILHDAVLAACDATDGARDGLIAEPAACQFDIDSVTCPPGSQDSTACLTPAEAEVARRFYSGPHDPMTGKALTAGQPQYGSELDWAGVYVPQTAQAGLMSAEAALPVIRNLAFEPARPAATLEDFDFTTATLTALRARHTLFDATDSDLGGFAAAGGKLILWHGLADPHISPANTVAFHKAMVATMGAKAVAGFERLYLLPGVAHCGNGAGPDKLDLLSAMIAWVEDGTAPDAIMTTTLGSESHFGQPDFGGDTPARDHGPTAETVKPAMSRPVYPYPFTAAWDGTGDVRAAESWRKGPPAAIVATRDWPGADLFGPYHFRDN